ncbi:hypothetical protein [uncultured Oscillibacter sp.]|uniref:glycine-rich domain-containing protein n=1 Tax=uncultured Oscillibacter sp. TaxID=876091 RepID=UPI0025CCA6D2|nr:hypothetical protein [uncultured Oscillibacter sp.]
MEQRIVKLRISNEYITGSGVSIGTAGGHDDVLLEMDFRPSRYWDGTTRRAIFSDALGENRTPIILTTDLLAEGQSEVYLVPVPQEAKTAAGECFLTVEGFVSNADGKEIIRCVTEEARFRVLPSKLYVNDTDPVTPSQAEQLQAEIDSIKSDIVEVKGAKEAAAASEAAAAASEANAKASETAAAKSEAAAAESARSAAGDAAAAASAKTAAETARAASETAQSAAESSAAAASASETAAKRSEQAAAASEESAAGSAQSAAQSEGNAKAYAEAAAGSAAAAASCKTAAESAQTAAAASEENAEYWAKQAEQIAGGDIATRQDAQGYVSDHNTSADAHSDIRQAVQTAAAAAAEALTAHVADTVSHVTAAERTAWNAKANAVHAARHAAGGADPITPAAIGAAAANHTHTPASIGAAAANHTHTPASIGAAAAWKLIAQYKTAGSYTWTVPAGVTQIGVYMVGGGGSGAVCFTSGTTYEGVTGGASGYGKNIELTVSPGQKIAAVVGAGGAAVSLTVTSGMVRGNTGGTTSFHGETALGGEGGQRLRGADGGQGSDAVSYKSETRELYAGAQTITSGAGNATPTRGGLSQSPRVSQNRFDPSMVSLSAGGWAGYNYWEVIKAMPDGTKGGSGGQNGVSSAVTESATGNGNGGGAETGGRVSAAVTITSGSGSPGMILIYAKAV